MRSDDDHKPVRGKKDRKRWCGGKESVEHKPQVFRHENTILFKVGWLELCCSECGKRIDWFCPSSWALTRSEKKPDWVTAYHAQHTEVPQ